MGVQARCLGLVTNAIVVWNSLYACFDVERESAWTGLGPFYDYAIRPLFRITHQHNWLRYIFLLRGHQDAHVQGLGGRGHSRKLIDRGFSVSAQDDR